MILVNFNQFHIVYSIFDIQGSEMKFRPHSHLLYWRLGALLNCFKWLFHISIHSQKKRFYIEP